jgi:hypothetical protein
MTDRELFQQCYEWFDWYCTGENGERPTKLSSVDFINALRDRLAQPKREWIGLTNGEFLELAQTAERGNYLTALRRMQAKLKEKNCG